MMDFPPIQFAPPVPPASRFPGGWATEEEWGCCALVTGIAPADLSASPFDQAYSVFGELDRALGAIGMGFGDVVRTWLFADRILEWYADLNRARDRFFDERGVRARLTPASTGVGWTGRGGARIVAGAFAVRAARPGAVTTRALPSPLQCPALEYGSSFSRAVEVSAPGWRRVIVSGTAAIKPGSHEVAHRGDVRAQVDCAMEATLAIYRSRGMSFADLSGATAYVKDEAARAAYRDWLRRHPEFPAARSSEVVADICRDDWLFELESDGIVFGPGAQGP